jgi:ATP-dependent RNA helicase DHX57
LVFVGILGTDHHTLVNKVLVMGAILGCRSAALGMAAGISLGRSPFMRIDDHRRCHGKNNEEMSMEDVKRQRTLEERSKYFKMVGYSDHAVLAALFLKWNETGAGGGTRKTLCDSVGLSFTAMRDIQQLALQLDGSLKAAGFVPTPESDHNSKSWRIIRTCAVSAMAPSHLVKIRRPAAKYLDTAEGARAKDSDAKELKLLIRTENAQEERVFIHPSSANFSNGNYSCPILVYNSLLRTSKPFLRDVTECSAYSLLLFGGTLEVKASKGTISVDGWVELSANARIGTLVGGLRMRLDKLMTEKAKDPSFDIAGSKEMQLIVKLIASDGLG